jgi:Ca2+-binding RTX toxin-like protein
MTVYVSIHDDQTINGGDGSDQITVAPFLGVDHAVLNGGGGDDLIDSHFGSNITLNGQAGADLLEGHTGDHFIGGGGVDTAIVDLASVDDGITANLSKLGTSATVTIAGTTLNTVEVALIALGDGDDRISTTTHAQLGVYANGGDDVLIGRAEVDLLAGGAGSDLIKGGDGSDVLYGYAPDQIFGFSIPGIGTDDGTGHDTLIGGGGADFLVGSLGDDKINGGADFDTVSYANATAGVSIDLHHIQQDTGGAGHDTLVSVENVIGGDGADHLVGNDGVNVLTGGGGADTIEGGDGSDVLSGGGGSDVFVFSAAHDTGDVILDLGDQDQIDLSRIDANTDKAGNQAFHLVDHLSGHAGELTLTYDSVTGQTFLVGDTDGDHLPDLGIAIAGNHADFAGLVL